MSINGNETTNKIYPDLNKWAYTTNEIYLEDILSPIIKWMSIYDNETTDKIYPDLSTTAPQEPQTYYFKKLTEI